MFACHTDPINGTVKLRCLNPKPPNIVKTKLPILTVILEGSVTTWQAEIDRENKPEWKVRLDAAGKVLEQREAK
jgi:hypothetical protein